MVVPALIVCLRIRKVQGNLAPPLVWCRRRLYLSTTYVEVKETIEWSVTAPTSGIGQACCCTLTAHVAAPTVPQLSVLTTKDTCSVLRPCITYTQCCSITVTHPMCNMLLVLLEGIKHRWGCHQQADKDSDTISKKTATEGR